MFTHTGFRAQVGRHPSGPLGWRTEVTPGRTHALNQEDHPLLGTRWRSLCGEVVQGRYRNEWGEPVVPNVRPASDPGAWRVTCRRCLRALARSRK